MARVINIADPRPMLLEARDGCACVSSCSDRPEDHESLTMAIRGIMVGTLLSGVCWAALIFAARQLSQLMH